MDINQQMQKPLFIINISLTILWIYQGLVPKILFKATDEQRFWHFFHIEESIMYPMINVMGTAEIIFGLLFLYLGKFKFLHYLNILGMLGFSILVLIVYPQYYAYAFNPFVMNVSMAILSLVALRLIKIKAC